MSSGQNYLKSKTTLGAFSVVLEYILRRLGLATIDVAQYHAYVCRKTSSRRERRHGDRVRSDRGPHLGGDHRRGDAGGLEAQRCLQQHPHGAVDRVLIPARSNDQKRPAAAGRFISAIAWTNSVRQGRRGPLKVGACGGALRRQTAPRQREREWRRRRRHS